MSEAVNVSQRQGCTCGQMLLQNSANILEMRILSRWTVPSQWISWLGKWIFDSFEQPTVHSPGMLFVFAIETER